MSEYHGQLSSGGVEPARYHRESIVALEVKAAATESPTDEKTADARVDGAAAPLVEDELLVEEVSIDGMCGVY